MYGLDTNTLSNLFRGNNSALNTKFVSVKSTLIFLPIIVAEEQLKGRMAFIASLNPQMKQKSGLLPAAYQELQDTLTALNKFTILPYSAGAERIFQGFSAKVRRIGLRDCRIAAIALENGITLVTNNVSHFSVVPGLKTEDWG